MRIKKKLRDLTEQEYSLWNKKNCRKIKACRNCPFMNVYCCVETSTCWISNKYLYSDKFLDQVIEIEVEMPKLTADEKVILRNLNKQWKYIARDGDTNELGLYCKKPSKTHNAYWDDGGNTIGINNLLFDNLFKFIQWNDAEPYLIENLLEGQKNE